ncbi:TPA: response regulator [Clostridioides difficile]|nr:response regulator [Clostridioides difficile]HBH3576433.1 response regulator [Clostridioides difficile]
MLYKNNKSKESDIQVDKLTGIDVAKKIRKKDNDSEIIFIISVIDYIQDGYKVRAYRYLLKPIQFEDLKENIQIKNKNKLKISLLL